MLYFSTRGAPLHSGCNRMRVGSEILEKPDSIQFDGDEPDWLPGVGSVSEKLSETLAHAHQVERRSVDTIDGDDGIAGGFWAAQEFVCELLWSNGRSLQSLRRGPHFFEYCDLLRFPILEDREGLLLQVGHVLTMITYLNRHEHQVGLRPKLRRLFRNLLRNCEDSDRQAEEKGEDWTFHIRSKRRIMQFPATCKASRRQNLGAGCDIY